MEPQTKWLQSMGLFCLAFAVQTARADAPISGVIVTDGRIVLRSDAAQFKNSSGIFNYGDNPQTQFVLTNEVKCSGLSIKDEYGKPVRDVQPQDGTFRFSLINGGYYTVRCQGVINPNSEIAIALTHRPVSPQERASSKIGVFAIGDPVSNASALDMLSSHWSRSFVPINGYQPSSQGLVWTNRWKMPPLRSDVEWIKVMTATPAWLRTNPGDNDVHSMYPPSDQARLKQLVQTAIQDDPTATQYLEPLNEPEWHWKGRDEQLVQYFAAVKSALAGRPNIKILGSTPSTIKSAMLKHQFEQGLLKSLDGLSIHAYGKGAPEFYLIPQLRELDTLLQEYGKPNLPIYVTEIGWTTWPGVSFQPPVSEVQQAQYLTRAVALLAGQPNVAAVLAFCFYYYPAVNDGEGGYSMVRPDYSPKPSLVAYAQLTDTLSTASASSLKFQTSPDGAYFVSGDSVRGHFVIAWTPGQLRRFTLPCSPIGMQDMMGRPLPTDGSKSAVLGEGPVYLWCSSK